MKGWEYAVDHPDEAAEIVLDSGAQDENHQKRMMGEVAKLTASRRHARPGRPTSAPSRRCSAR